MRHARRYVFGTMVALMVSLATAGAQTQKPALDIMLKTTPDPPVMGKNTVEVMVKVAGGKPVTDAEVSADFFMAAMPAMKMPEM